MDAVQTLRRGDPGYPPALATRPGAPTTLRVLGGHERLARLLHEPAVAIAGSERPSDYGLQIAASLARGLAAAGVTVLGAFADGIAAAAHEGALEIDGPTVALMAAGPDRVQPARRRGLHARILQHGCALALQPPGVPWRPWHATVRARTLAALAALTVIVEADQTAGDLLVADAAQELERPLAAVPGRVTSPVSRATNALIAGGAPLVRGPADVLDLLHGVDGPARADNVTTASPLPSSLPKRLLAVLERVGAGQDTPGRLTRPGQDPAETLAALAELELMGLLARGDGGRYVPRQSLPDG